MADNATSATEQKVRPTKPNEETFKADLAQAEKEHAAVQEKLNQIKAKIETAKPNNKDSPAAKRQQELRAELSSIRQKQQGFKASRSSTQEKINALESTLKARIAEQNNSRGRMSFKNVEELDREIVRLEKQVDSGTMRLVDEKKALADVSTLRKQRKNFASLEEAQNVINDLKAQIASLKKTLDNPEAKALSDKYTEIQKELDAIKAEQDGAFKNLNALRDERTKLHGEQQQKWTAIREIKDTYHKARKAYKEYEDEAWRIRREKQKAQREAFEREKRKKIADKKLEEASRPAYTDEILIAQGLIRHFNPSYDFSTLGLEDKKDDFSAFRAQVGRTVDDASIKGMKVLKKDDRDEDYFVGTGSKKGKKGKKGGANGTAPAPAETAKFNLNVGVIEDFAKVKIDPPMNQSDVPAVVEKLAAKITEWKKDQSSKTEENIKKAQEEIKRLEEEEAHSDSQRATDHAKKVAIENSGVNGKVSAEAELKQENDAAADVSEELQKASLEDSA
ncbi:putative nuclear segregation protein (Bfr1) [Aspergillus clavatus NRRL 1]|uniref:Nuclear segregation protein (Bfr1), putative n=1 Tax=Aspergillus clavatus (strain ATCC 1007 / CBS 513.65 / DSM 816 / NCTC 3887 / NRRL 1 / QM 1276 / 107) TaxID=344612 RepID=A1CP50_ASPCL|nr:nuclear segregation protein (Bfr1), putative [Aspergillus clavatus NRRL 1]EAW07421.1 nuclear segregation protein (Bfr1), putative [Aspergillus clavatus NRRL 1]